LEKTKTNAKENERNCEYVINDLEKLNLRDWIHLGKNREAGNELV
jgi:hypothetical protein